MATHRLGSQDRGEGTGWAGLLAAPARLFLPLFTNVPEEVLSEGCSVFP